MAQGTAQVQLGDRSLTLQTGETLDVPVGTTHRLENPGPDLLVVIEVQFGTLLDENDIVRIADDYGRLPKENHS